MKILSDTFKIEATYGELLEIYEGLKLREKQSVEQNPSLATIGHVRGQESRLDIILHLGFVLGKADETGDWLEGLRRWAQSITDNNQKE